MCKVVIVQYHSNWPKNSCCKISTYRRETACFPYFKSIHQTKRNTTNYTGLKCKNDWGGALIVRWQHRVHNNKLLSLLFSCWVAVNYKLQFIAVSSPVMVWSGVHTSSQSLDRKAWVLLWIIFQWNNSAFSQSNNLLASHPNYCNAQWKLFCIAIKLTITDSYTLDI